MRRYVEPFRGGLLRAHQEAEEFYADLVGEEVSLRRPARFSPEDAPTIRLSTGEVLVCVGGVINATVTAVVTNATSVTWAVDDTNKVGLTPSGNSVTIRGKHPGVTTLRATATGSGGTATATARVLVIFVEMTVRNTGTIEPSPENEDEADETAAAGGTNALGPLPMGSGRGDFPNVAYTSPCLVVGRVFPPEAATRFTFRWQRLITRRSWQIRHAAGRWTVTLRSQRGPLDDDTGADAFNDSTPSVPGRRLYMYDDSAATLDGDNIATGEFVHEKKDFIYRVFVRLDGRWSLSSAIHVGQVITARRDHTGGTVATDWTGIENSIAQRRVTTTITVADVRAIVGGADPIDIAAGANP